jgi:phosphatidylglycerol:prolipoprotein diacylglycerol transferase
MIPDNLHIGPVHFHIFGIMIALAFIAAGSVSDREFARKGFGADFGWTVLLTAAVGGLVGARFWSIVSAWDEFTSDPLRVAFGAGGLVWYGGFMGGVIAVTILFRRTRVPWLRGADAAAPALALGHAIGRIGCQLAGDGDWGIETKVPGGMAYPYAVVGWDKPPGVKVHPTPIYEMVAYFAIFLFLWSRRKRGAHDGVSFAFYLVLAGAARFLVEFVRTNPRTLFGLSNAQVVSVVLIVIGAWLLMTRREAAPAPPRRSRG